jgi:hypothetical protein
VILHPLEIDGDIAFHEMEFRVPEQRAHALGLQVHAVNMPIGVSQDVLAQVMTDESIDPENENVFQNEPLVMRFAQLLTGSKRPRSFGARCASVKNQSSGRRRVHTSANG